LITGCRLRGWNQAQAFAAALEAMTLKERRAALAAHYATGKKNTWTK
jgi:hypothetical protein